jgi:hypothetical protein
VQQLQYVPEAGVQDRVAARYVEVGQAVHPLTHLAAGVNRGEATLPRHLHELRMSLTEYVTMFATLVANVRYVPLKSKVFHSSKKKVSCVQQKLFLIAGTASRTASCSRLLLLVA